MPVRRIWVKSPATRNLPKRRSHLNIPPKASAACGPSPQRRAAPLSSQQDKRHVRLKMVSRGRITLPADVRAVLGVKFGDHVILSQTEDGAFILRAERSTRATTGADLHRAQS